MAKGLGLEQLIDDLSKTETKQIPSVDILRVRLLRKISNWVDRLYRSFSQLNTKVPDSEKRFLVFHLETVLGEWLKTQLSSVDVPADTEGSEFRDLMNYWQGQLQREVAEYLLKIHKMSDQELVAFRSQLKSYESPYEKQLKAWLG